MKCPRCRSEMRMKRNRGQYTFICPKCKYRIGKRETNEELKQDINTDMDVTGQ